MAKPASSKLKRLLFWVKSHKFYSLLILIVLLVAGYFVYDKIALELNKRAFQNARAAIDAVYADIVKEVGPPDNSRRQNECSKSNFGPYREIISCSVHTDFVYGVTDEREADGIMENIKRSLKRQKILHKTSAPNTGIDITPAPGYESAEDTRDFFETRGGLLCIFKYVYDSPSETYIKLLDNSAAKSFYVTSGCTGNARDAFYSSQTQNL